LSKLKSSPCLLPNIAALRCCKCFVAGGAQLAKVSGSVTTTCEKAFSGNRSSARLGRGDLQ
jgi:hypothetical protein